MISMSYNARQPYLDLPHVNDVLGQVVAARQIRHRGAELVLLRDRNDLLFAIALALNTEAPFFQSNRRSHIALGADYSGVVEELCL